MEFNEDLTGEIPEMSELPSELSSLVCGRNGKQLFLDPLPSSFAPSHASVIPPRFENEA